MLQKNFDSAYLGEVRMKKTTRILSAVLLAVFLSSAAGGSLSRARDGDGGQTYSSAEERRTLAGELGLSGSVDGEGYLTKHYLADKSTQELEAAGAAVLVRSYSPGEERKRVFPAARSAVNMAAAARAGAGRVTASELVRYMNTVVGYFEVNGIQAFCAEHGVNRPLVGETTSVPVKVSDVMQRKVLYYGYIGPAQWSGITGFEQGRTITSLALSYYYSGPGSLNWNIHGNYSTQMGLSAFIYYIQSAAAPPESFTVYKVSTGNGAKQDLMYWEYNPHGYLTLQKSASDAGNVAGNSLYTLSGAEYGVYTDAACRVPAVTADRGTNAVLVTDVSGRTGTVCLNTGTYYIKETKAPRGYEISPAVTRINVTESHTAVSPAAAAAVDKPVMLPAGILLRKVDAETGGSAQGEGTLEGAVFRVRFYGIHSESNPGPDGNEPLRTWTFTTDAEGRLNYSPESLQSGDSLYFDASGNPVLPYGTLTFEEISAPPGYLLNSEIITAQIREGTGGNGTIVYQEPVQKENVIKLSLKKVQADTGKTISGAVFEHTDPQGKKAEYATDENGSITICGLRAGNHTLREIHAPEGLLLNENVFAFTVEKNGGITVTSKAGVSETDDGIIITTHEAGRIDITAENRPAPFALRIIKKNPGEQPLAGAEFTLYADRECRTVAGKAVTGEDGTLTIEGLSPGKDYYLKETEAPPGYRLPTGNDGGDVIWEIRAESDVAEETFLFYVDGKTYDSGDGQFCVTGGAGNRTVQMTIYNETGAVLPKTGSNGTFLMTAAGTMLTAAAFTAEKRKKRKGENR